jgi:hypothetical protein
MPPTTPISPPVTPRRLANPPSEMFRQVRQALRTLQSMQDEINALKARVRRLEGGEASPPPT